MKKYEVTEKGILEKVAETIRNGGIVVFPTETAYGLAGDATSDEAVQKVFALKKRVPANRLPVIVADIHMAEEYVVFGDKERKLASTFWPGPLSLLLKVREMWHLLS